MSLQFKRTDYNWGDTFYVYNENDERQYFVRNSILLMSKKFEICDIDKNVLVTIKKDPKSIFKKKFDIIINDEKKLSIIKEISLIPKYTYEGMNLTKVGVMLFEYKMDKDNEPFFSISSEVTKYGQRPVLNISNPSEELMALAVAITISYIMDAKEGGESADYI